MNDIEEDLTDREKEDFKNMLKLIGFSQTESIKLDQFIDGAKVVGIKFNDDEKETLKRDIFNPTTQVIEMDSFYEGLKNNNTRTDFEQEMMEAFNLIDRNKDGRVSQADITSFFRFLGFKNYNEEKLMRIIDPDLDGYMSYDEFVKFMITKFK